MSFDIFLNRIRHVGSRPLVIYFSPTGTFRKTEAECEGVRGHRSVVLSHCVGTISVHEEELRARMRRLNQRSVNVVIPKTVTDNHYASVRLGNASQKFAVISS